MIGFYGDLTFDTATEAQEAAEHMDIPFEDYEICHVIDENGEDTELWGIYMVEDKFK